MNKILKPGSARPSALALLSLSAVALAGSVSLSRAQPTPGAEPAGKAATQADRPLGAVRMTNPGGEATLDLARGVRHATRNVQLWQEGEDFILYADDVTQYEKDNTGTARSNLHVESRDSTIIGDLMRVDFTDKVMTLTGNVILKSHGEKDGLRGQGDGKSVRGEVLHKPSSLTCDRLDYDYETKQATLSGNIRMRQGENFGTCERILFDESKNIVRLIGNVKFINGDSQTIEVPEMTIWIDNNMIQSPGISTRMPHGKGKGPARPPRRPTDFGPAPKLPDDITQGNNSKPPPALPPLSSGTAKATGTGGSTSSEAAPSASAAPAASGAKAEAKADGTPDSQAADAATPAGKSG